MWTFHRSLPRLPEERAMALLLERGDEARLVRALTHERDFKHAFRVRLQLLPRVRHVQ